MKKIPILLFFLFVSLPTFGYSFSSPSTPCTPGVAGGGSTTETCTISNISANDELLVYVAGWTQSTFNQTSNTLVDTAGSTWHQAASYGWDSHASPAFYEQAWYAKAAASETTEHIVATFSSSETYWGLWGIDIGPSAGIDSNSCTGCTSGVGGVGYSSDSFAGGTVSFAITLAASGDFVVGGLNCTNGCATITEGSGYSGTVITNITPMGEYQYFSSSSGSQNITFGQSNSGTKLGGIGMAFLPPSAATPNAIPVVY